MKKKTKRQELYERDLAIIKANAEQLNAEAEDVFKYQVNLEELEDEPKEPSKSARRPGP